MYDQEMIDQVLPLFKALADKNRLKIIGLLAQKPHAVEALAETLGLGASTVSHHLTVLGKAGLVAGAAKGYYSIYSLQTGPLEEASRQLLHKDQLKGLAEESAGDEFERKVLAAFMTEEGRIKAIPAQEKKFMVL